MKRAVSIFLISICLISISCSQISNVATGSVYGKVTSVSGNAPISGVIVECGGGADTTSADGTYRISNILTGIKILSATKSDFEPYSKSINITSIDKKADISLTPSISGASVWGYIRETDGQAISGASVKIANMTDTTDANGRYQLPSIPQGNQSISVSASGYETKSQSFFMYSSDKQIDINLRKEYVKDITIDKDTSVSNWGSTRSGIETILSGNNCLHYRDTIYLHATVSIPNNAAITGISLAVDIISTNVSYSYNWIVSTISQSWSEYNMNNGNEPTISSYYSAPCVSVVGSKAFINIKNAFDNDANKFITYGFSIKPTYNNDAVDWIGIDVASREYPEASERPFVRINYLY